MLDVFITGAGTPGLILAILLGKAGIDVAIADVHFPEPVKKTKSGPRTVALMPGSVEILKKAGVWEQCEPHGEFFHTLRIIDETRPEVIEAEFKKMVSSRRKPGSSRNGAPFGRDPGFRRDDIESDFHAFNIPDTLLRAVLGEEARKSKHIHFISDVLSHYETNDFHTVVHLENGEPIQARLLAGADGRHSRVREIVGIQPRIRETGQTATVCVIQHTKPHGNICTEFHYPGGPLTLVPLSGERSAVVWVDRDDHAEKASDLFLQTLQEKTKDVLGAVSVDTGPMAKSLEILTTPRLTAPRMALMAEAAHVLHPMGAQGLNLSLRDAEALAGIVTDAVQIGIDPGSAPILETYERARRGDVDLKTISTGMLNASVRHDIGLIHILRRAGLKKIERAFTRRRP